MLHEIVQAESNGVGIFGAITLESYKTPQGNLSSVMFVRFRASRVRTCPTASCRWVADVTGTPAESTMTNSDGQSKDLTSVLESSEEDNAFASNMFGGNGKHSDRDVFVHQMPKRRESSLSASGQWGRMRMSLHAVSGLRRRKRKGTHLM